MSLERESFSNGEVNDGYKEYIKTKLASLLLERPSILDSYIGKLQEDANKEN